MKKKIWQAWKKHGSGITLLSVLDRRWPKAMVVRYGLYMARRLGYQNVWVESDAINVIQAVKGSNNDLPSIRNKLREQYKL